MTRFLVRRVLSALATLIVSSFAVCMLIHLIPGDPVMMMMAQNSSPTPEQIARMRQIFHARAPFSSIQSCARTTYKAVFTQLRPEADTRGRQADVPERVL